MEQNPQTVAALGNQQRNAYVVTQMTQALLALLQQKPLEDISISELCDKAQVGRTSFYRNFARKEDILAAHLTQLFGQWAAAAPQNAAQPLSSQLGALFAHFEQHRAFYALLYQRGALSLLKGALADFYRLDPHGEMADAYARAYVVNVLYGWVEVWFQRGMQDPAQEIAALFRAAGL